MSNQRVVAREERRLIRAAIVAHLREQWRLFKTAMKDGSR
jgi:hypothetical protein